MQGTELDLRTRRRTLGRPECGSPERCASRAESSRPNAGNSGRSQQAAQAEAAFREQQNQMASQQGWNQALQGQQNQYNQGLQSLQWNQEQQKQFTDEIYRRMMKQNELQYGRDVTQNTTDYDRQQNLFRQQMAQHLLPWEQQSTLANIGLNTVGARGTQSQNASNSIAQLLAQQGSAQALAPLNSATQME